MSNTIGVRHVGDVAVVDVAGRITLGEGSVTLRDAVRDLAKSGQQKVLLNLAGVSYIDSSGIGELVAAYTSVRGHGGEMKLLSLMTRVQDLLQITKLYTVFEVFDNEPAALRSFEKASATTT